MGRQGKGRCQGEPQLDTYRSNREKDQQGKGAEGPGSVWTVKPAGRKARQREATILEKRKGDQAPTKPGLDGRPSR